MKKLTLLSTLFAAALVTSPVTNASTLFEAFLSGSQEVGPNASPASGFGTVVLNDAQTLITVDESWFGLLAPATASHIHGPGAPGVIAPVLFPFSGVPAATSGAIPEQSFAITPTQVAQLQAGLFYMNVHSSVFPGGEIRGQLVLAPEPATLGLMALALAGLVTVKLRRS